jgi:putative endonuclease
MYILKCSNNQFYTGSTINIELRLQQHQNGEGSNFTKKHLPVELVYFEKFQSIKDAFNREKQVQGWSQKKKLALINSNFNLLNSLSECKNDTHFLNKDKPI